MMCLGLLYQSRSERISAYILFSHAGDLKEGAKTGQYHITETEVKGSPAVEHVHQCSNNGQRIAHPLITIYDESVPLAQTKL